MVKVMLTVGTIMMIKIIILLVVVTAIMLKH